MIFDVTTMFSDKQAISATANSTNTVDFGNRPKSLKWDIGKGTAIPLLIQVVENFGGTGTVQVICQSSNDEAFPTGATAQVFTTTAVQGNNLRAGHVFSIDKVTIHTSQRYMRLRYVVSGTITAGKITAGITMGNQMD